ncbi:LPXTG-motif cell wall anchor domain protein [Indibacter alkaliphilus LW1]|uniref:LPXTG-motif cell wall anchor domain protein n=1 Tax=Indibacter alkaliphilus (strain CCUG 57479 / KCTC 22604 / LW1) TaxID=1189612 RepID=S2DX71_INDAL|nr:hypothetical protein [Indibacter alkaliphilus]EOZ96681.1 LPXTG-motif cell wall anchor domain protein [Indibacter alkaliphilus LW1]
MALVVAGGGGGGRRDSNDSRGGGGGGAGGAIYIENPNLLQLSNNPINIVVGLGGSGSTSTSRRGSKGQDSKIETNQFNDIIAEGGGGGGSALTGSDLDGLQRNGGSGGSGGGGTSRTGFGGAGSSGFRGGNGVGNVNDNVTGGGGGGGAGGQGQDPNGATNGGRGGIGLSFNITNGLPAIIEGVGENIFAGGGGGVGGNPGGQGSSEPGGSGIGGNGNNTNSSGINGAGGNGITNTGSGGGAGFSRGGNGSSGIVIIKYNVAKILPVEFLYFRADYSSNKREAILNWATAKEWENSHFEVERSISGIKGFEKVGEVEGMGWTDQVTEYQFIDQQLPLGSHNVLYRLKQVDFSGEFQYSDVVSLRLPGVTFTHGVWRAYPNPTNGTALRIALMDRSQYDAEKLTFRIVHPMYVTEPTTVESEDKMNELLSNLALRVPKGVFVVEIQWGQKVEHIKILKQH